MKEKSFSKRTETAVKGKKIVLGVSGCIAAYKACTLTSLLKKAGAEVKVVMTKHATEFVGELTFETLSGNRTISDMFSRDFPWEVEHIALAKWADMFVIAPATANVIAKIAGGIGDDMLTTTVLATKAPVAVYPAMNTAMFDNVATQENIKVLRSRGVTVAEPSSGMLACGDVGRGRLPEPEEIFVDICEFFAGRADLLGKTVVVTAGGTSEPIDPVRSITNRSSGKMGVAIAENALQRGAEVVFIHGNISVAEPKGAVNIAVSTTLEMQKAVESVFEKADAFVMAAAPADYRVENVAKNKIKAEKLTLDLVKNPDIAAGIGAKKGDKKLIIFSAETENLIENAENKLKKKNADFVVANDVTQEGAGFGVDTNVVTIIGTDGKKEAYGVLKKSEVAKLVVDKLA